MVDNILLKTYDKTKGIFIDRKPARKMAEDLVEKLGVVTPSVDTPVSYTHLDVYKRQGRSLNKSISGNGK